MPGRAFVGGFTYVNRNGRLELVRAVEESGGGVAVLDPVGGGFPRGFSNDTDLVSPKAFVLSPRLNIKPRCLICSMPMLENASATWFRWSN